MSSHQDEIRQLLEQIEAEYLAGQNGLAGLAESAKHAAINARMENLGQLQRDLHAIVGDDATRLLVERLEQLPG